MTINPYWWNPEHPSNHKPKTLDDAIAAIEARKAHDESTIEHAGHDEFYVGRVSAYKHVLRLLNELKES